MPFSLTRTEARAVKKHVSQWFKKNPSKKTCPTKLGSLGVHVFHRDRFPAQITKLVA